jgi:serine/threonine-protein kinase
MRERTSFRAAGISALSCLALLAWCGQAAAAGTEFSYGTERSLPQLPSPLIGAQGVGADAAGNVYAIDGNRVLELPPGTMSLSAEHVLPFAGMNGPQGLAVDGAGDVYVADTGNRRVVELPAGGGAEQNVPFSGLQGPSGVAVDGLGDVFVSDTRAVLELPAGGAPQKVLPFGGDILPTGVAVDSTGNVYAVDGGGSEDVLKLAPGAGSPTDVPNVTGRNLAIGPHDELYVGGHTGVEETPAPAIAPSPDEPLPLVSVEDVQGVAATAHGLYVAVHGGSVYFQPAGATPPAGQSILPFSGSSPAMPTALALDGTGNVVAVLDGRVLVQPIASDSPATARLAPILTTAGSVATDGAGNVFAAVSDDVTQPSIVEWPESSSTAATRHAQNDRIDQVGADAQGNVYWTETHQGPFADLGSAFEVTPGSDNAVAVPFLSLHAPEGMAVSPSGDVYVSSAGEIVVVRAGTHTSAVVPFATSIGALAVDEFGGVYGTTNTDDVAMLPAGGCQAGQVRLPFTGLGGADGLAVDPSGDVFAADAGNNRVVVLPATGSFPAPPCPLQVSHFRLRAKSKHSLSLRFTLTSSHPDGIRRVVVQLPAGRLRFAHGKVLRRGLKVRTNNRRHPSFHVRSHGNTLTITLKRPAGRLTFKAAHGAIYIGHHSKFGFISLGPVSIEVTGATGSPIQLSVPTKSPSIRLP